MYPIVSGAAPCMFEQLADFSLLEHQKYSAFMLLKFSYIISIFFKNPTIAEEITHIINKYLFSVCGEQWVWTQVQFGFSLSRLILSGTWWMQCGVTLQCISVILDEIFHGSWEFPRLSAVLLNVFGIRLHTNLVKSNNLQRRRH